MTRRAGARGAPSPPRRGAVRLLALLAALTLSCSTPAPANETPSFPLGGTGAIPLTTVVFSGHRYVARADIGLDRTIPLMVHGNARMFLSLTHRAAEALRGRPVEKIEAYGYSEKGKGVIDVPTLRVGSSLFERLDSVPVFDFTDAGDTTIQGMLGTPFLLEAHAALDFSRDALVLDVPRAARVSARLLERGYAHVPMKVAGDHRVTIEVNFPSLQRAIPITPSTVSTALTLHRPLFDGRLLMRKAAAPDSSPSGTSPEEYVAEGVSFQVGGVPFECAATLEDLAEYGNVPESDLESYGMLGYDWMKAHAAILDYANLVLYFKP